MQGDSKVLQTLNSVEDAYSIHNTSTFSACVFIPTTKKLFKLLGKTGNCYLP